MTSKLEGGKKKRTHSFFLALSLPCVAFRVVLLQTLKKMGGKKKIRASCHVTQRLQWPYFTQQISSVAH